MIKVALTGNIGSGKSTICKIFEAINIPVFIADIEAKLLYKERSIREEIRLQIGDHVFDNEGRIDFELLANEIFTNKKSLSKINEIIHPRTLEKYHHWIENHQNYPYSIHESAILFENGLHHHFDKIINVSAPFEIRLKRIIERDGEIEKKVLDRMKNQMDDNEKNELADIVIVNDGNSLLIPQVLEIDKKLKR